MFFFPYGYKMDWEMLPGESATVRSEKVIIIVVIIVIIVIIIIIIIVCFFSLMVLRWIGRCFLEKVLL